MPIFTDNPLKTRADVERLVRDLVEPVLPHFSAGRARVKLGENRAGYGDPAGLLEGFARPLWGLIPLAAGGGQFEHWELWRTGIQNGTDPDHPEFWGWAGDFDQRSVEAAAFGVGLALAPRELWEKLDALTRERFAKWLGRLNEVKLVQNNWLFFRVLVNIGLRARGQPWNAERLQADLARLDDFYLGNGWYQDGASGEPFRDGRVGDYYVPMAFHFYSLIYAHVAGDADPTRAAKYLERARLLAKDFIHYFSAEGSALPFGRSLTYRFAQGAFWGALAFAPLEALPWPMIKGLYLRNLRWWLRQPIFTDTGLLTIGYGYPNLLMAESYNSSGSPYWAFKTFLPLALPNDHPFWRAEEAPLPSRPVVRTIAGARFVAMTDPLTRDVVALNPGQEVEDWPRHAPEKYSKFAYSTRFGFSVPCGPATPQEGGFDSMLALSDDHRRFRGREHAYDAAVENGIAYSRWTPWPDVEVRTWLIAAETCHVRVHHVRTPRALESFEAGFAAGFLEHSTVRRETSQEGKPALAWATANTPTGNSWLRDMSGERSGNCVDLGPNSHLLSSLAVMPSLRGKHPAGEFWLACAVGGQAKASAKISGDEFKFEVNGSTCRVMRASEEWWSSIGDDFGQSSPARLNALTQQV